MGKTVKLGEKPPPHDSERYNSIKNVLCHQGRKLQNHKNFKVLNEQTVSDATRIQKCFQLLTSFREFAVCSFVAERQPGGQMSQRGHPGPAPPGARTVDGPLASKGCPLDVSRKFKDGISRRMKVERRPGILPVDFRSRRMHRPS